MSFEKQRKHCPLNFRFYLETSYMHYTAVKGKGYLHVNMIEPGVGGHHGTNEQRVRTCLSRRWTLGGDLDLVHGRARGSGRRRLLPVKSSKIKHAVNAMELLEGSVTSQHSQYSPRTIAERPSNGGLRRDIYRGYISVLSVLTDLTSDVLQKT